MDIKSLIAKLGNSENLISTEIDGVRFRGEVKDRFEFKKANYDFYAGNVLTLETPTSIHLGDAIFYSTERMRKWRYRDSDVATKPSPLVMAIDMSKYHFKQGEEHNECVILEEIDYRDIVILFDDKIDYLRELINESWYGSLIHSAK